MHELMKMKKADLINAVTDTRAELHEVKTERFRASRRADELQTERDELASALHDAQTRLSEIRNAILTAGAILYPTLPLIPETDYMGTPIRVDTEREEQPEERLLRHLYAIAD